ECVFIWPKEIGEKYKDFNEWAKGEGLNEIPVDIVKAHRYRGCRTQLTRSQSSSPMSPNANVSYRRLSSRAGKSRASGGCGGNGENSVDIHPGI
ncbi:MAG: hypothetical protein J6V56_07815, partial [Clostridia bacterium]|nr:hypothetical protein [Clostridia bacterium]